MSVRASARTASEDVTEQIRAQIATGRLKPGDMLPSETALLDHFQVARPTMREALRVLESDGLIEIQLGVKGGARVQEPDVGRLARRVGLHLQLRGTDLKDMMQAEIAFHPGAVALAAFARTDYDLAELRAAIDQVAASATSEQFATAAAVFLDRLSHASHNQLLTLMSELTTELMRYEISKSVLREAWPTEHADLIKWSVQQYATVVDLIEARDGEAAEGFWREHLRLAYPDGGIPSPLTVYRPWGARRTPLPRSTTRSDSTP